MHWVEVETIKKLQEVGLDFASYIPPSLESLQEQEDFDEEEDEG